MLIADRYEATGAASWGGMAEVHSFRDRHLDRQVVLKRIKRQSDISRLLDEQKALLAVRSKHVVSLLDIVEYEYAGETEKGLILEYIDGHDLCEGDMLPDTTFIKTLWQIASGLADIHSAGVIHRDIKPSNIRVDASGVVKIIDFGLSRQIGIDDSTRSVIGSFGYLAPELNSTGVISFTPAVDVFAFGATAMALCQPIARQVGRTGRALVEHVLEGAEASVIELVNSCIAVNPVERPSIKQVRDTLSALLLNGRHRAWLNNDGRLTEVNSQAPSAKINAAIGLLEIEYTGTAFVVKNVSGSVNINNMALSVGQKLPQSCVIIFGTQGARSRAFVTFDSSNPAVMA